MKGRKYLVILFMLLCLAVCGYAAAENQYYAVPAEVQITGSDSYILLVDAQEGWQWNITEHMDVTSWLVTEEGDPAFAETEGVAFTRLVYGPAAGEEEDVAVSLEIHIDAAAISAFAQNGTYDLYVYPKGKNTIWVAGENKGQYQDTLEKAGTVMRPKVSVDGVFTGDIGEGAEPDQASVPIVLTLGGIDDGLIDSSNVEITLLDGDGYYRYQYEFDPGSLGDTWNDGVCAYTFGGITGAFSPQGGDGNGHYVFRIAISGLKYNGLPLDEAIVKTDFYSYGRTFSVTGGSLIQDTAPIWSSEADTPVLCDAFPDTFGAVWPIGFDASGIVAEDVRITLLSEYGDELTLEPGTDYTLSAAVSETTLTTRYIYWAYAPVYTQMKVDLSLSNVTWNGLMYAPGDAFSHTFDIASVYAYFVMGGGPTGTQGWTYFGLDGLTEPSQIFYPATYTLSVTDGDGNTLFYGEDDQGNGVLRDAQTDAVAFRCDEECEVRIEESSIYYKRLYDQTEEKVIGGETITFDKLYHTPEVLPMPVSEVVGVTPAKGYAFGASWEDHLKWPWQSFINEGYLGGTK